MGDMISSQDIKMEWFYCHFRQIFDKFKYKGPSNSDDIFTLKTFAIYRFSQKLQAIVTNADKYLCIIQFAFFDRAGTALLHNPMMTDNGMISCHVNLKGIWIHIWHWICKSAKERCSQAANLNHPFRTFYVIKVCISLYSTEDPYKSCGNTSPQVSNVPKSSWQRRV